MIFYTGTIPPFLLYFHPSLILTDLTKNSRHQLQHSLFEIIFSPIHPRALTSSRYACICTSPFTRSLRTDFMNQSVIQSIKYSNTIRLRVRRPSPPFSQTQKKGSPITSPSPPVNTKEIYLARLFSGHVHVIIDPALRVGWIEVACECEAETQLSIAL